MLPIVNMDHIQTTRLIDLSHEAVICDAEEVEHLRHCEECDDLLQTFAKQSQLMRDMLHEAKRSSVSPFEKKAA